MADEELPKCIETGERAEICLNPLGVLNRLNMSQIQEQYINFMCEHLVSYIKEHDSLEDKENEFFKFMKLINKNEGDFLELKYIGMNRTEREQFFEDIIQDGIYIHQFPFFGNPGMNVFKKIFVEMPELCSEYHFENIERPMVMGDLYFIRLKHESIWFRYKEIYIRNFFKCWNPKGNQQLEIAQRLKANKFNKKFRKEKDIV